MNKNVINTICKGLENSYNSFFIIPSDIILFLTYRCTSRCKTCNIWKRPSSLGGELSWAEWHPLFEKIASNNIRSIEMFGGDALLRKELLFEMLNFCKKNNIDTYFPTNSNLVDEKNIEFLFEAGLGTIYFSLDELPAMGESIRGIHDHFRKVDKAISIAIKQRGKRKKPRIVCITTVSKHNYKYLRDFVRYAESSGVDTLTLRGISEFPIHAIEKSKVEGIIPEPYFMPTDDDTNILSLHEARELISILKDIKQWHKKHETLHVDMKNLDILTEDNLIHWQYPKMTCVFCTTVMTLSPSADVVPCPFYNNYILGNLQHQDIGEIWGNNMHRKFCVAQRKDQLDLCNYCSIKFYHKKFGDSIKELAQKAKDKIFDPM